MDAVSHLTAPNLTPTGGASPQIGTGMITSDFETFLVMLTTQMQNQDPLNPMDSTDFATQLATFSGVEQQVRTNDLLADLGTQFGVISLGQLAGWVGMEARSAAPVNFVGAAVEVFPDVPAIADQADLLVSDAQGRIVQKLAFDPTAAKLIWDGRDASGRLLPHGQYALAVQPYASGAALDMRAVETFARVTEVRQEAGQTVLILPGGIRQPAESITALRDPAPP